jgi:aspartyl protease family protein
MGLDLDALTFSAPSETANGVGYWAPYTAANLTVGPIRFTNMPVAINKSSMSASLLGMSFLKRLDSFEVRGDQITLKWRGG